MYAIQPRISRPKKTLWRHSKRVTFSSWWICSLKESWTVSTSIDIKLVASYCQTHNIPIVTLFINVYIKALSYNSGSDIESSIDFKATTSLIISHIRVLIFGLEYKQTYSKERSSLTVVLAVPWHQSLYRQLEDFAVKRSYVARRYLFITANNSSHVWVLLPLNY